MGPNMQQAIRHVHDTSTAKQAVRAPSLVYTVCLVFAIRELQNEETRVQVPNYHIKYTLLNSKLHNYYPKPKCLSTGSFGPLG